MSEVIRVNFSRPMPVFPLRDTVLLPHAILPLQIFEPRYRQMIDRALDEHGQIAMARLQSTTTESDPDTDFMQPAVCVGQIVQHETSKSGRRHILLHGVCRAEIAEVFDPTPDRLYHMVRIAPLERVEEEPPPLERTRSALRSILQGPNLKSIRSVDTVLEWFEREEVTTHALLELIGFSVVRDLDVRYHLLAEARPTQRAKIIAKELAHLDGMIDAARRQSQQRWPKGVSWN